MMEEKSRYGRGFHEGTEIELAFRYGGIDEESKIYYIHNASEKKVYYFTYSYKTKQDFFHGIYLIATRMLTVEMNLKPDTAERVGKKEGGHFHFIQGSLYEVLEILAENARNKTSSRQCNIASFQSSAGEDFCLVKVNIDDSVELFMKQFEDEALASDTYQKVELHGNYHVNTDVVRYLPAKAIEYLDEEDFNYAYKN